MIHLQTFSYRFAEQVLNSRLALKQEVEAILTEPGLALNTLSRPTFNHELDVRFTAKNWERQPLVFSDPTDPAARMDFLKDRVGVEVGFGHGSFLGIDLLKFQVASYSALDRIDVGIYILTTRAFQSRMKKDFSLNWDGSLTYEKVLRYLPHFKSAIQIPLYVIGIDV